LRKNKKGISPLIATVLLIGFTIVLAALVMRWGGTLFRETTQTTGCESQGRIACSSQVEISVGSIAYGTAQSVINSLIVNNLAATQDLEAFNVQREFDDGSVENQQANIPLVTGASLNIASVALDFSNPIGSQSLSKIHVSPIFTQTTSDGASCRIVCSEQKITVPATDPRVTIT